MALFVNEGVMLGLIGGTIGLFAGLVLAETVSFIGIPMPPPPGTAEDVPVIGEILVTWPLAVTAFVLSVGASIIATLYPAWKASRLEVVDALRHNR